MFDHEEWKTEGQTRQSLNAAPFRSTKLRSVVKKIFGIRVNINIAVLRLQS